jgi:SCY1-like protein 1
LTAQYKKLTSQIPQSRLDLSSFIERGLSHNGFFQDDFIQTALFLENMSIKDDSEKQAFLK